MKNFVISFSLIFIALTLTFATLNSLKVERVMSQSDLTFKQIAEKLRPEQASIGKSNRIGRAEYDWLRLRNPATNQIPRGIRTSELEFAKNIPSNTNFKNSAKISTQDWTLRGPVNIGGRTRALKVDVTNPNRILAGGVTGGMWISEDGGDTWTRTTDREQMPGATCVAQDTREGMENVWYYGSGEYQGSGSRDVNSRIPRFTGDGVFKSTDGGESWTQLESTRSPVSTFTSPFDVVYRIATNPANLEEDEVLVAAYGSIMRSIDGGETWETVLGSADQVQSAWTDIAITPDGVMYATVSSFVEGGGIYRSTNGVDWVSITEPNFPDFTRMVIGLSPAENYNTLYFLGLTPDEGYIGSDGGASFYRYMNISGINIWENLTENFPNLQGQTQLGFGGTYNAQGGYNMVVAVHPLDPSIVYIGGTSLFMSTNAFANRQQTYWIGGYNRYFGTFPVENPGDISYPYHHADVHNIAFDPNIPDIIYCSHDGGLSKGYQSTYIPGENDPFPWDYIEGYTTTQFYWVGVDPITEDDKLIGGMQDNGTWISMSPEFNQDWFSVLGGDGMACAIGAGTQPGNFTMFASTQYGGTFGCIELDADTQFVNYQSALPPGGNFYWWITPFDLSPIDYRGIYVADGENIWQNPDLIGGEDFSRIPGTMVEENYAVTAVGASADESNIIYYSTFYLSLTDPHPAQIFRVENAMSEEAVVTEVSDEALFPPAGWVHCISVDPQDANRVFAVVTNYGVLSLFFTDDGGQNWREVGGNLEENPDGSGNGPAFYWAEFAYVEDQPFYLVGTTIGLFSCMDIDTEDIIWALEGPDDIGNVWVSAMDVRHSDNYVAIGTHGGGAYSGHLELTSVGENGETPVPTGFALNNAYPNPFNSSTRVSVTLPATADLRVEVFNSLGRRIAILADQSYQAGDHEFFFRADNLASGTYFIQASSPKNGWKAQQKVILVK